MCGREKTLDQFSPNKKGKYGRSSQCRQCAAIRVALYRQTPQGKQTVRAYAARPERRAKAAAVIQRWRAANYDQMLEKNRQRNKTVWAKLLRNRADLRKKLKRNCTPVQRQRWTVQLAQAEAEIARYRRTHEQNRAFA